MKIYYNGDIVDKSQVAETFEPGFLFGWGLFEPFRAYRRNIPFLKDHITRLNQGLDLVGIEKVEKDWETEIKILLKENELEDAYIRITVYKKRKGVGVLLYVDKFGYYGSKVYEKGFSATVSPHIRCGKDLFSKLKSISYLRNRISWLEAQAKGKEEALVVNPKCFLAGGSRSNLFLVKDKEVFTPRLEDGAFDGITRRAVIDIVKESGLILKEKEFRVEDIYSFEEAFITSSLMEVMPLVEVEDKKIGKGVPGEVTLKILSEYRKKL